MNPQFFTVYGNIKKDAFFTLKEFLSNIFKTHPHAVNVVSVIGDTWGISPNNTFDLFTIYRAIAVFRVREMNKLSIIEILPKWGESSSSLRLHINNNLTIIIFTGVSLISCMFYFSRACATHLRHKEKKKKAFSQDDLFPEHLNNSAPNLWREDFFNPVESDKPSQVSILRVKSANP